MNKIYFSTILLLVLGFSVLESAKASPLDCGDSDEATCKAKFEVQFEKDFKALQVSFILNFINLYIEKADEILKELPENTDAKNMVESSTTIEKADLEQLKANEADNKKIAKIADHAFGVWEKTIYNDTLTTELKNAIEKLKIINQFTALNDKLYNDAADLFLEMYVGIRPKDLEAYPIYKDIEKVMQAVKSEPNSRKKFALYDGATHVLSDNFNMPYIKVIRDIV